MRRAYLVLSGQSYSTGCVDESVVRATAVALGYFAVNGTTGRGVGDPVHEWVTEGRRLADEQRRSQGVHEDPYSSCADLAHWLLMCLGCQDERVINRSDDGGTVPWQIGANISRLVGSPWYVPANRPGTFPKPGDIFHVCNDPGTEHIAILEDVDLTNSNLQSFDYGQPYGLACTRRITNWNSQYYIIGGRRLRGWIDISKVAYTQSAVLPPDCLLGMPDDNPYLSSPIIPDNIP